MKNFSVSNQNKNNNARFYDAIFIGNALCDVEIMASKETVRSLDLQLGSMTLIEEIQKNKIQKKYSQQIVNRNCGGSAANSAYHLGKANKKIAFIGSVSNDDNGDAFLKDFESTSIDFIGTNKADTSTGTCTVLCSDGGERTMLTYLGCAVKVGAAVKNICEDFNRTSKATSSPIINENGPTKAMPPGQQNLSANFLFVEGYILDNGTNTSSIIELAKILKMQGSIVALSASDASYINFVPDAYKQMLEHCDVLFCNAEELWKLCSLYSSNLSKPEAMKQTTINNLLKDSKGVLPKITVCTNGENGCNALWNDELLFSPAKKTDVKNTNGAGDAYAAETLNGMLQYLKRTDASSSNISRDEKLEKLLCIPKEDIFETFKKAHGLAASVIEKYGAR